MQERVLKISHINIDDNMRRKGTYLVYNHRWLNLFSCRAQLNKDVAVVMSKMQKYHEFLSEKSACAKVKFRWQVEGTWEATKHKQSCSPVSQKQKRRHTKKPNPISCACCLLLKLPNHWTLLQRSCLWVQCLLSDSALHRSCYVG